MTYDSFDTIPFKLFIRINESGDITLLSKEKLTHKQLAENWKKINDEFEKIDPSGSVNKTLKTLIKIERYTVKYNALKLGLEALRFDRNLEIENLIREAGFKLQEQSYHEDLDRVESESEVLLMLIEEQRAKLPKVNNQKANSIDEVIMGYCAITGLQYDTNTITGTQFYGLKSLFEEKKKNLERQQANLKNKK